MKVYNMEHLESTDEPVLDRDVSKILCCHCTVLIEPNSLNMCVNCSQFFGDITDGIPSQYKLYFCNGCKRYLQPPAEWVACTLQSRELFETHLLKVKAFNGVKLIDVDPEYWYKQQTKKIRVRVTIEGEVIDGIKRRQSIFVYFNILDQKCEACHRSEDQDFWRALIQVRQRADNRKSFYYLEQLILKHKAHENTLGIKSKHDGLDFYYMSENHARKMVDFIQSVLPIKSTHSKKLISHDIQNNVYIYMFTYCVEIAPVSKDSLVCLPKKLTHQLGCISSICLVSRVTSVIHLIDVGTGQVSDVSATVYWRQPFKPICSPKQLIEYIVMDIDVLKEKDIKPFPGQGCLSNKHVVADVWVVRACDLGLDANPVHTRTHLGHLLKPGDTVLGYNLGDSNVNDPNLEKLDPSEIPDVFLVKKFYGDRTPRRSARNWKLKHMAQELHDDLDSNNDAYNEFLDDLEEDPALRQHVNIFKDAAASPVEPDDDGAPRISLAEMLDDLTIDDVKKEEKG